MSCRVLGLPLLPVPMLGWSSHELLSKHLASKYQFKKASDYSSGLMSRSGLKMAVVGPRTELFSMVGACHLWLLST